MSLRIVIEPKLGLLDGPEIAGALEYCRLELACEACHEPIADARDAWCVWSAELSWAPRGTRPFVAHERCRERLIKARYRWDRRPDVRVKPLLALIAPPLARALTSVPPTETRRPSRKQRKGQRDQRATADSTPAARSPRD